MAWFIFSAFNNSVYNIFFPRAYKYCETLRNIFLFLKIHQDFNHSKFLISVRHVIGASVSQARCRLCRNILEILSITIKNKKTTFNWQSLTWFPFSWNQIKNIQHAYVLHYSQPCSQTWLYFFLSFHFLFFCFFLFIFLNFYLIFKLYIIVLVLPNIKMNPPQVHDFRSYPFDFRLLMIMWMSYLKPHRSDHSCYFSLKWVGNSHLDLAYWDGWKMRPIPNVSTLISSMTFSKSQLKF